MKEKTNESAQETKDDSMAKSARKSEVGKELKSYIRGGIKEYFHRLFDIHDDMMDYKELDEMMEENTVIHGSNMWILMLAILIASIGLNVNSTAVIIGAMLISPLMSGILTMGYALAVRDLTLLRKALKRFGTQVCISLAASTVYFLISPLSAPTEEMIARISPTLWDVLIALFGGIAGIIGNTRQKERQCNTRSGNRNRSDAAPLYRRLRNCHAPAKIHLRRFLSFFNQHALYSIVSSSCNGPS